MLTRLGYESDCIQIVNNGLLCVEYLSRSTTAERSTAILIFMDVFMPIMGGLDATTHIRQNPLILAEEQPYIIALTANAMAGDRKVCIQSGMDAYLTKPVTLDAVRAELQLGWEHFQHDIRRNNKGNKSANESLT